MGIFFNNTNIPTSANIYLNSQASNKVYYNNTLVWEKQKVLWQNGDVSANSGGWSRYYMNYVSGQWEFGNTIYLSGYNRTSSLGTLVHTNNKIHIQPGTTINFYISGSGSSRATDTNVSLWKTCFWLVFLPSLPSNPLPFGDPQPPLSTCPKKVIWEGLNQHYDWTYGWPVNNATVSNTITGTTGDYYIGFFYHGYDATCDSLNINSVVVI